jgi:NAD(P)-dependent dehydrogenase (short-subunit alcohol dehydrogenase family)
MPSFADRVILITGAGSGLGRQFALQLAAEGAVIAAVDLRADSLEKLTAELPGKRLAWEVADVTDVNAIREATAKLQDRLGPIDILIANAGIGIENSALAFRAEDFNAQIQVNLIGVANSVDAVLRGMMKRQQGHIVAISSLASYRGLPRMAGYCASKAGVNSLCDTLRFELRPLGIRVTTICPYWIETPLTANINVPKPNMMDVESSVRRIIEAIRAKKTFYAFPFGPTMQVRLLKWLPPRWSDWMMARAVKRLAKRVGKPGA